MLNDDVFTPEVIADALAECRKVQTKHKGKLRYCLKMPREEMREAAVKVVAALCGLPTLQGRYRGRERWFLVAFDMLHPLERYRGKLCCRGEHFSFKVTEGASVDDVMGRVAYHELAFSDEFVGDELPDVAPRLVFVHVAESLTGHLFEEVYGGGTVAPAKDGKGGSADE